MRDSVPNARYSSVCNVLHQWSISLIPTYRVYRLYDITYLCMYASCAVYILYYISMYVCMHRVLCIYYITYLCMYVCIVCCVYYNVYRAFSPILEVLNKYVGESESNIRSVQYTHVLVLFYVCVCFVFPFFALFLCFFYLIFFLVS